MKEVGKTVLIVAVFTLLLLGTSAGYAILVDIGLIHMPYTSEVALYFTPDPLIYDLGALSAGIPFAISDEPRDPHAYLRTNTAADIPVTATLNGGDLSIFDNLEITLGWMEINDDLVIDYTQTLSLDNLTDTTTMHFATIDTAYKLKLLTANGLTIAAGAGNITVTFTYGV